MRNEKCTISVKGNKDRKEIKEFTTVILLGENHGHRMKSYGPISLIDISGKTLLKRQVESVKAVFKNYEIILCTGFDAKKITDYVKESLGNDNIRVVENQLHFNSNCCESARLCINNTNNGRLLICSGGVLLTPAYLSELDYYHSSIAVQQEQKKSNFSISAVKDRDILHSFCLGHKENFWTESLFLKNQKTVEKFCSIISDVEFKNKFIFEAVNELVKTSKVKISEIQNYVSKLDNLKTLKRIIE